jgi:hypothetical protein
VTTETAATMEMVTATATTARQTPTMAH